MKGKAAWLGVAVMMVVLGIALAGCATGPSSSPGIGSRANLRQTCSRQPGLEPTRRKAPNVAYIQTLPAKKVVSNQYQGKPCI